MKVVYICHPVSGDVKGNIKRIKKICRSINLEHNNIIPFVPYMIDILALDDDIPTERKRGIKNNTFLLENGYVDEVWVYGHKLSSGMQTEIEIALNELIPVKCMEDKLKELVEDLYI